MERDPIRRDGTRVAYGTPVQESALAVSHPLFPRFLAIDTLCFVS